MITKCTCLVPALSPSDGQCPAATGGGDLRCRGDATRPPRAPTIPTVPVFTDAIKRVLVGRPMHSERLAETLLPKRIALPVFASDALSSVAYAPDEIFLTLAYAGVAAYAASPWIGLAVVFVMLIVVASYRQNVHAYPSGGGDYEVASTNLGKTA